ncbi:hypothetical protein H6B10_17605, partial [Gemmiger formicilis]|nr:hypothetical protein [Gemmiger formicilis]
MVALRQASDMYKKRLSLPFSSAAKYCDRKSPNGGQRTCKEVAAEEVAKSRTVDPA